MFVGGGGFIPNTPTVEPLLLLCRSSLTTSSTTCLTSSTSSSIYSSSFCSLSHSWPLPPPPPLLISFLLQRLFQSLILQIFLHLSFILLIRVSHPCSPCFLSLIALPPPPTTLSQFAHFLPSPS